MVHKLNELIKIYDNVLDSNICKTLIEVFESNKDKQERIDNERKPNFTQFNLTENCSLNINLKNIHNHLIQIVFDYRKQYYKFVSNYCFPEQHNFEQFRIKKYNCDGKDAFDIHVDVKDYSSARRFLSFFWYLNDVENGGETVFDDLIIKPKTGRMVIFPPLWMFPHQGKEPISNEKYLLSTYLHYR